MFRRHHLLSDFVLQLKDAIEHRLQEAGIKKAKSAEKDKSLHLVRSGCKYGTMLKQERELPPMND